LNTETRWTLVGKLVVREVGGQVFILMPDSTMHILENESAVHLYGALPAEGEVGATLEDLSRDLVTHFEVSADQARIDVSAFLERLAEAGVVRATDAG
jgi:hypothetical protein